MSPDRREFYLGHKSGVRVVNQLPADAVMNMTVDARFPIDLCCTHTQGSKKMHVFFSSKMISVAKVKEEDKTLGELANAASASIRSKSISLPQDVVKNLPRRKGMRSQEGYNKIPISAAGELTVDSKNYPVLAEMAKPAHSLPTKDWYVWLSIILETPGGARTTLMKQGDKTYFVLQNAYHIVMQEL